MNLPTNLADFDQRLIVQLKKLIKEQTESIEITSAYPLSQEELNLFKTKLGISDPEIIIENKVEKDILGGLIIKFGNQHYYDLSIKGKIAEIGNKLNL